MAMYVDVNGHTQQVAIEPTIYNESKDANQKLAHFINTKYTDPAAPPDLKLGTVFQQICASTGLTIGKDNPFGMAQANLYDVLENKAGFQAAAGNTAGRSTPFGTESRVLFPAAIIQLIEDFIQPDRTTDTNIWNQMVATTISVATESFLQPVLSYNNANGANANANGARAQRIAQLGNTPMMLRLTTSDRFRTLPVFGIGMEMSEQAMKATTLDLMALTTARFLQIERDQRVYTYASNMWAGDLDHNTGAVTTQHVNVLDTSAASGTMTHKAWVKWLATNRKKRVITHVMADIDTYLKVEGRVGRPGTTAYDPRLATIDPQAVVINDTFGGNVKWFIVDPATAGGPVPAGTIWGLDAKQAIMMVENVSANFTAIEQFILRRSQAMAIHWSSEAMRLYGDADLSPFDAIVID